MSVINTFLAVKPLNNGNQLFSGLTSLLPILDWSNLQTNNSIIHHSVNTQSVVYFVPAYCPEYIILPCYNLSPEYPNWSIVTAHVPENQRTNILDELLKPKTQISLNLLQDYQCEIRIHTDYIAIFEGIVPKLLDRSKDARLFSQKAF